MGGESRMGRTRENKATVIAEIKELLSEAQLGIVIDYQGLSVAEITDLRNRLRPSGAICKVTKNTFMEKAVTGDEAWEPMTDFLKGTSAFVLVKDDVGSAVRAYQSFKKDTKKPSFAVVSCKGKLLTKSRLRRSLI